MRIDKWLWCARFYKTRAMASDAVKKGKVQINNNRAKPAQPVRPGDAVGIRSGPYTQQVTVLALAGGRKGAAEAALLYREQPESIENRRLVAEQMKATNAMFSTSRGRPTKRERRKLVQFRKRST